MRARPFRFAVALLGLVLLTISCSDRADGPTSPTRGAPAEVIADGAHGGNPHFYFLQPMVPKPSPTGTADANASPTVVICRWQDVKCGEIVAYFNSEDGTGSEVVRYDAAAGSYHVNWHTDQCLQGPCALENGVPYRLRVLVGATSLGHADVMLGSNGAALRNVDTDDYIPLVNGRTLPVKFRIEVGAVQVLESGEPALIGSAGGEVATADGQVALTFPSGALTGNTSITVEPVTEELPGVGGWAAPIDLGPDGSTFAEPVMLTMSYDVSQFPEGLVSDALAIATWQDDHWEFVPGSVVNTADATVSAPIEHFSVYYLAVRPNWVVNPTVPLAIYVGDVRTFTGFAYSYRTEPREYCETRRIRVGFASFRYETVCRTYTASVQVPAPGIEVTWWSYFPSVMTVGTPNVTVTDENGMTESPACTMIAFGLASLEYSAAGTPRGGLAFQVSQSIAFTEIDGTPVARLSLGLGQGVDVAAARPVTGSAAQWVAVTHSNPGAAASVSPVLIEAFQYRVPITMRGQGAVGVDTARITATGYGPDSLVIEVDSGVVVMEGWPPFLATGDSARVALMLRTPDGARDAKGWGTAFQLEPSEHFDFTLDGEPLVAVPIENGANRSFEFWVRARSAGDGSVTVRSSFYRTLQLASTVLPPPYTSISVDPSPAGVKPGEYLQLRAVARDDALEPVPDVAFTWSSSNPAIATVDAEGQVSGIANGVVTITATSGDVSGAATVHVGIPSVAPTPTTITIQVQQGQTNTGTITINNGGTGLLTGLLAGGFSDYYSGGAYSWMTTSFNTTTAPATLTISASPPANYPAGSYKMRFEVWAPGVNAFTFYSINVTIVPAGVTPVDATIAPNPTTLAFSVEQGQAVNRTINISNTGTAPLTNLSVGTFSNYYNGSPAPWVTATVSPTTAPATITITAAPTDAVIAETHRLRFEVMSPGATNSPYTFFSIDVTVLPRTDPPFVAAGGKSSCALRSDGSVLCWGEASYGATSPPAATTFSTIGGGFFHYCGIRTDQTLRCWGYESDGRTIPPAGTYDRISVAPEHACALRPNDTAACWGFGGDGRASPPAGTYRQIGNGWYHGCGVRTDQTVVCWGQNGAGQATPLPETFKSVSGGAYFTCGIRTDDTIACWGSVATPPTGTFTSIASSTSGGHACGIRTDETLACWGQNDAGQSNPPAGQFLQVSTNNAQSCAVRKDRAVLCWGFGGTGATNVPAELQSP